MEYHVVLVLLYGIITWQGAAGLCTWPSIFQSSIWLDSDRGTLTFTSDHVTGWGVTFEGTTLDEWECYHVNDSTSATFNMILRSTGTYEAFTIVYTPFVCLQMTKITDYSYSYYQQANEESRLDNDRIFMYENYAFALSTNNLPTENDLCSPTSGPVTNEYHLLVKNDQTSNVYQNCSTDYWGNYSYTLTDPSGTTYCGTGSEVWDVCTDYRQMTFDYNACSTNVAYSSSGTVACVHSVTSGSYLLTTVLNLDIILSSDSFRFTCLMSTLNSDSSLTVSQAPGSCTKTQVPGSVPTLSNGTQVGYTMALSPGADGLCPITTTSTTTTSTTTTTTTPTTTTTTPTTTTTTPTTTTTTPTTTTTTPTTTTTTPTTTTTTPTTTTTTPTTTTTTPTTTTTTPTTTTTTPTTTTTTPTTTTTTLSTTTEGPDNTLSYVAIGLVAGVFFILLVVIVIVLIRHFCCKKEEKPISPPPMQTPDLLIEAMPHHTAGWEVMPYTYKNGPTGTGFMSEEIQRRETLLFPAETKSSNVMISIPQSTASHQKSFSTNSSKLHATVSEFSNDTMTKQNNRYNSVVHSETSTYGHSKQYSGGTGSKLHSDTSVDPTASLMDTVIMDEKVNFALLYHPRMIEAKEQWDRQHGKCPDEIVTSTAVPLSISKDAAESINQSFSAVDTSVSGLSPIHPDNSQMARKHETKRVSRISDKEEIEVDTEADKSPKHSDSQDRNTVFTSISSREFKTSSPLGQVQEVRVTPYDLVSADVTIPVSPHESTIDTITFTGDYGRQVAPRDH